MICDTFFLPVHPAVAHFPIALFTMAGIFGIIYAFKRTEAFKQCIFWTLFFGLLFGVAAIITGNLEEESMVHNETIHEMVEAHEQMGYIVAGVFLALFAWFSVRKNKMRGGEYAIWLIAVLVGVGATFYQGYLGGEMVYKEGAGVKPMEKHIKSETDHEHAEDDGHAHDH